MIANRQPNDRIFIYKLVDPKTGVVGYVGQTKQPTRRLYQHISEARGDMFHCHRNRWLKSVLDAGSRPQMLILQETVGSQGDWFERYWIYRLLGQGHPLTNDTDRLPGGRMVGDRIKRPIAVKQFNQLSLFAA